MLVGIATTNLFFGKCGDAKLIVSVSLGNSAVFRWRRQSCPGDEGHLCCLGHSDILVMDVQCQDEFLHCTDPGRKQDRTKIAFRWVKQRVSSCPLFKAGVACCLPTCAQGCSFPVTGDFGFGFGVFWAFWFLLGVLCIWGVLALLVSLLCTRLGLLRCASCWTRPLGGGRWEHYLCNLWGEYLKIHKTAYMYCGKPYMLALAGQPSLHGYYAHRFIEIKEHFGEIAGLELSSTDFAISSTRSSRSSSKSVELLSKSATTFCVSCTLVSKISTTDTCRSALVSSFMPSSATVRDMSLVWEVLHHQLLRVFTWFTKHSTSQTCRSNPRIAVSWSSSTDLTATLAPAPCQTAALNF